MSRKQTIAHLGAIAGMIAALPNPPPLVGEGRVGAAAPLLLPDKPSVAVLPFANMSGDPEQEYFVDGMVEEIITALCRIRWLLVIARNSSFTYKGQAVDVKQVGRELGALRARRLGAQSRPAGSDYRAAEYRPDDGVGRPRPGTQPEFRAQLAHQRRPTYKVRGGSR
jgi:hypothetical protein